MPLNLMVYKSFPDWTTNPSPSTAHIVLDQAAKLPVVHHFGKNILVLLHPADEFLQEHIIKAIFEIFDRIGPGLHTQLLIPYQLRLYLVKKQLVGIVEFGLEFLVQDTDDLRKSRQLFFIRHSDPRLAFAVQSVWQKWKVY